jgi:hypothetical protein
MQATSINIMHVLQVANQDFMILISQGPARVITRTDITGLTLELHLTQISRKKSIFQCRSSYVGLLKPAQ